MLSVGGAGFLVCSHSNANHLPVSTRDNSLSLLLSPTVTLLLRTPSTFPLPSPTTMTDHRRLSPPLSPSPVSNVYKGKVLRSWAQLPPDLIQCAHHLPNCLTAPPAHRMLTFPLLQNNRDLLPPRRIRLQLCPKNMGDARQLAKTHRLYHTQRGFGNGETHVCVSILGSRP